MASITHTTIPNYVLAFVHPGLYIPRCITTRTTEIAADIKEIYEEILLKNIPKSRSHAEIQTAKLQATEELKERMTISYDGYVSKSKLSDREHHGLMWERIAPFTSTPLSRMTKDHWKALISALSPSEKEERPRTSEGYRKNGVFIVKHPEAQNLCNAPKFITYLTLNNQSNLIPLYASISSKLPPAQAGLHPLTMAYFTPGLLTKDEKIFIRKYTECPPSGPEIPKLISSLIEQLTDKVTRGEDPIAIAAFAHMQMVIIHPFYDGNGRAARALANFILIQASIDPVIFVSDKEYTHAVETARSAPETFYVFLRDKVEEFTAFRGISDTDEKVRQLFIRADLRKAKELNSMWKTIPLGTRQRFLPPA